jgi:hypothetical protein
VGPAPAFGGLVHLGVEVFPFAKGGPWLSFAVEGRGDGAPAHEVTGGYAVTSTLVGGSLVACLHEEVLAREGFVGSFFVCPMGTAGSVRSSYEGGPIGLATVTGFYAGAGARLGFEGRLGHSFALRLHGAGLGTLGLQRAGRDLADVGRDLRGGARRPLLPRDGGALTPRGTTLSTMDTYVHLA